MTAIVSAEKSAQFLANSFFGTHCIPAISEIFAR